MRVLVVGGAGFIGSNFCGYLLNKSHEVICLDSFLTGAKDNLKPYLNNPNFKLVNHNIIDSFEYKERLDAVVNLACPASPKDYTIHQIHTMKVGAFGTLNTLGIAKVHGARYLLASTSEIYGDPLVHPQQEGYLGNVNSVGVRGVYDEAKRFGEALTMAYHRVHKVNTRIMRIFNTYGPNMRIEDGRAVCNFIAMALQNRDLEIYGDGLQTRSFCYVDDLVDGIYKLLMSDYSEPVNLGNPDEISILELAKIIIELCGSRSKVVFKPALPDDPSRRCPDISRAKSVLKWEPKVSKEDGLKKTISYFRERFSLSAI